MRAFEVKEERRGGWFVFVDCGIRERDLEYESEYMLDEGVEE